MNFIKKLFSLFKHKKQIKTKDNTPEIKGQETIYWKSFITKNRNKLKIFLSIISILSLTFILIISTRHSTNQLYNSYFEFEYGVNRGSNVDKINYYLATEKYTSAFILLEEEVEKNTSNMMYRYYYSICAMYLDKHSIAQENLKIISDSESILNENANWYLALSYLKTDKEKAIKEFEKISKDKSHYKSEEARKILKQLR